MGNNVWGAGRYAGLQEGIKQGRQEGGVAVLVVGAVAVGAFYGGSWAYDKWRERAAHRLGPDLPPRGPVAISHDPLAVPDLDQADPAESSGAGESAPPGGTSRAD